MPGSDLCEDCGAAAAEYAARDERQRKRETTKAERARYLRELAERGCGCASEAECRLGSTSLFDMPRGKARKAFEELHTACAWAQRWEREAEERRRARDAEARAKREDQEREIRARWDALRISFTPSPLLTALRRTVLAARDDRCPKWRFRLAPDLVVQIQPRPGERRDRFYLFNCIAIQGEQITKEHFGSKNARRHLPCIEFGIVDDPAISGWRTEPYAFRGMEVVRDLMPRLVEALAKLEALKPGHMLAFECLICGRALSDPASIARLIGPECADTASLDAGLRDLGNVAVPGQAELFGGGAD